MTQGIYLSAVLVVAAVSSAFLLGLAFAAFARRRSGPYLLIALAVATLAARTLVAGFVYFEVFAPESHHLAEHALDVLMVGLVIGAVYYTRTAERRRHRNHQMDDSRNE